MTFWKLFVKMTDRKGCSFWRFIKDNWFPCPQLSSLSKPTDRNSLSWYVFLGQTRGWPSHRGFRRRCMLTFPETLNRLVVSRTGFFFIMLKILLFEEALSNRYSSKTSFTFTFCLTEPRTTLTYWKWHQSFSLLKLFRVFEYAIMFHCTRFWQMIFSVSLQIPLSLSACLRPHA